MSYISDLTRLQSSKIPPNTAERAPVNTQFKLRTEGTDGVQETKLLEGSWQWQGAGKAIVSPHLFKSLKELKEFKVRKKKKQTTTERQQMMRCNSAARYIHKIPTDFSVLDKGK